MPKGPAPTVRFSRSGAGTPSRRRVLKAIAGAAMAASGPWIVKDAFSSSGELDLLHWTEGLPDSIVRDFESKTGIKVNATKFVRPEAEIAALQATKGQGYDLCQPNREQARQFQELGLLQPYDLDKLPAHDSVLPFVMEATSAPGPGTASSIICLIAGAARRSPGAPTSGASVPRA